MAASRTNLAGMPNQDASRFKSQILERSSLKIRPSSRYAAKSAAGGCGLTRLPSNQLLSYWLVEQAAICAASCLGAGLPSLVHSPLDSNHHTATLHTSQQMRADSLPPDMPEISAAKILIVDDDPASIELIASLFYDHYEVLFALNGEQALEIAARAAPDLILLDLILPGMDGFAVCKELKADPLTSAIPVLFITGRDDSAAETRALELGAVDYITKPINPLVLSIRVRNQMELKQARDRLTRLATTDGLTGVANRRRFDEVLAHEHAHHSRSGNRLGLIMLDIDHFKAYNDTYGHVLGDDCLCAVAQALSSTIKRDTDLIARYGGEEFACILADDPTAQGALALAEELRQQVAALAIPHQDSPTAEHVTISLGVITACCHLKTTPSLLIRQADEQLYQAKSLGRNRSLLSQDLNC